MYNALIRISELFVPITQYANVSKFPTQNMI